VAACQGGGVPPSRRQFLGELAERDGTLGGRGLARSLGAHLPDRVALSVLTSVFPRPGNAAFAVDSGPRLPCRRGPAGSPAPSPAPVKLRKRADFSHDSVRTRASHHRLGSGYCQPIVHGRHRVGPLTARNSPHTARCSPKPPCSRGRAAYPDCAPWPRQAMANGLGRTGWEALQQGMGSAQRRRTTRGRDGGRCRLVEGTQRE